MEPSSPISNSQSQILKAEDYETAANIAYLPKEILINEIFSKLKIDSAQSYDLSLVCKNFKKIIEEKYPGKEPLQQLLESKNPHKIGEYREVKHFPPLVNFIKFEDKNLFFISSAYPNYTDITESNKPTPKTTTIGGSALYQDLENGLCFIGNEVYRAYIPKDAPIFLDCDRAQSENGNITVCKVFDGLYVKTEKNELILKGDYEKVSDDVAFSSDNVIIGHKSDISVWDINNGNRVCKETVGEFTRIVCSKDYLAVAFANKRVGILNPLTLEEKYELQNHQLGEDDREIYSRRIDFMEIKDGYLYTIVNKTFKKFDLSNGKEIGTISVAKGMGEVFDIQDNLLAIREYPKKLQLWDLNSLTFLGEFEAEDTITSIKMNKVANGLIEVAAGVKGGFVQVWSPRVEMSHALKLLHEKKAD